MTATFIAPVSSKYGAPMGRIFRARDRNAAKADILSDYPDARFYR